MIALLDRRVERVHVDMDDLARPLRCAWILSRGGVWTFEGVIVIGIQQRLPEAAKRITGARDTEIMMYVLRCTDFATGAHPSL
jgi:hypothetical protein